MFGYVYPATLMLPPLKLNTDTLNGNTIGVHPQTQKLKLRTKQIVACESTAEEVSFEW